MFKPGEQFPLFGRSVAVLRTVTQQEVGQPVTASQLQTLRQEADRANVPNPHVPPLRA